MTATEYRHVCRNCVPAECDLFPKNCGGMIQQEKDDDPCLECNIHFQIEPSKFCAFCDTRKWILDYIEKADNFGFMDIFEEIEP